ncbi:MAG: ABC transporter substrate-binding protein [Candidatus Competibacteraceae bacterium]|nr:ABC transporter substrate-binding protein [Candidatus Competibacteraceae bacterium]
MISSSLLLLLMVISPVRAADPARELVESTTEQLLNTFRAQLDILRSDPRRRRELVETILVPHLDFETAARWVLGRYWRRASPEQRREFVAAFRRLLLNTYGTAFTEYLDIDIRYRPGRYSDDGRRAAVEAVLIPQRGPPVNLEYRLHRRDGAWKGYDVIIDGISFIVTYRNTMAEEIRRYGLDGLLERLEDKIEGNELPWSDFR